MVADLVSKEQVLAKELEAMTEKADRLAAKLRELGVETEGE